MPETIVFIVGLFANITGVFWVRRSSTSLAKHIGLPLQFINTTLVSIASSLPFLAIALISGPIRKEPGIAMGAILGFSIINTGILLGLILLFLRYRPDLGFFSRTVNVFILVSFLLLVLFSNVSLSGWLSLILILLGASFLLMEYKVSVRTNNIVYKFEEKIETYLSIFTFAKKYTVYVELVSGILLILLGSSYIVDSIVSLTFLLKFNGFFLAATLLAFALSVPNIFIVTRSIFNKGRSIEITGLIGSSTLNLTFGIGVATILSPLTISYPVNIFAFGGLIFVGIMALLSIWKKTNIFWLGILLTTISFILLTTFSALVF